MLTKMTEENMADTSNQSAVTLFYISLYRLLWRLSWKSFQVLPEQYLWKMFGFLWSSLLATGLASLYYQAPSWKSFPEPQHRTNSHQKWTRRLPQAVQLVLDTEFVFCDCYCKTFSDTRTFYRICNENVTKDDQYLQRKHSLFSPN